ncbi:MAG: hypothetical protein M0C28_10500 [Candidatus Moduliflexus flocculans]|nr:hypothetical protein [Candidatus Moduliflexus flocculans]
MAKGSGAEFSKKLANQRFPRQRPLPKLFKRKKIN